MKDRNAMEYVLKEAKFYTVFDVYDWIEEKIEYLQSLPPDMDMKEIIAHYNHLKYEIAGKIVKIMKDDELNNGGK